MTTETEETITVELYVRSCENCRNEAVALMGRGTDCLDCDGGQYGARVRTVEKELTEDELDGIKAHSEEEIREVYR